ncbi:hypothetical protein H5410_063355 [Solanum commersonii]|uniref:HECT-type E3 ubiquitin transferase n=1 Tax=Solanum commersonii TaxID=4109 RepID=A0A9J5WDK3_SOLCO|nr:hypothetical protein H5410_063355 [Solanum commersonii]
MFIDRSMLLDVSFEYIVDQDPALLRGDLLMQFKHEEAIGSGVLREWFFLVCREMFNPHKALFVACPNDRRRFFPNSASKVDPLHLEYFTFCGRMIALALMHKIQIGVVFDRVFFLQLAGEDISLEDIRDADPTLYSSCKQILEMDPETVDQDILSLTFAYDVEELGPRTTIELCPNGKDIVVNSKNRKQYVNLLIQHRFVISIASQIAHFSQGFSDITTSSIKTSLFRSLYLEDLDKMLDGSGTAISVEDWKAHTDYNGYEENDSQISWFWKIVEGMSAEKKKVLLFFWTSIWYLPLEGFRGLDSRLCISRTSESCENLPSAQTCFYLLRVPSYCNSVMMQDRIDMITQEHIGCSFGNLNDPSALTHGHHIIRMLKKFLVMNPMHNINEKSSQHFEIFISSSVPEALVMLYLSPDKAKKHVADESIHRFIDSLMSTDFHMKRYSECAGLILVFCKLLRRAVGLEDPLYSFCRSTLRDIVEAVGIARCKKNVAKELLALNDAIMFVREVVVVDLSREFELSMGSVESTGLSLMSIVCDFTEYMCLARTLLQQPFVSLNGEAVHDRDYIESLHRILSDLHIMLYNLLDKIEPCLRKLEDKLRLINDDRLIVSWWSQYLVILKELNNISMLFNNSEVFWQKLSQRKLSLSCLIGIYAMSFDDYRWIIEHKELIVNFKVRRHFTMRMLEEARSGNTEESYEMLIDRSDLLEASFEYIVDMDPALLRGDLLLQFKHEDATGPGVLREWFFLVCREMFNPHKALFVACPNDRRRFFPNSASKVDPLHLEYFTFCDRMIALALMHKIQIGVVFDRVFFLQLAEEDISLEDIRDADPTLYKLGSRTTVELLPNGKDVAVNTSFCHINCFADSSFFSSIKTSLFRSLYLGDLDKMLYGSGTSISVEDWKAHTNYNGYKENYSQISWFWKIVEGMSAEKKKALLFFWTSIRYLPLEGFRGLDSRLCISRTSESCQHLPSAQTCFYQLRVPPYFNRVMMQNRLEMITQEHIGCSFGNL